MADSDREAKVSTRPAEGRARRSGGGLFRDPVVKGLAFAAAGLVVLYLLTVVAALFMGVLGDTTPKTRIQRDAANFEKVVEQNPGNGSAWKSYVQAVLATGEYARANQIIERAAAVVDETGTMDITTARAEVLMAQKKYEEGIEVADQVITSLSAYHEEMKAKEGSEEQRGKEINANFYQALLMKAEAYIELDRADEAIAEFDRYLEGRPAAADVLARRGEVKARIGDVAGAEADLREALKYLPGDEAILEALDGIGVDAR